MERQYLLIENPGVVGTDLLRIVGASASRGQEESIGQFGSGFKYSIALLMRNRLDLRVYIGKDGFEFGLDSRDTHDVRGRTTAINEVVMKQIAGSSRKSNPMGFDVTFGEMDWDDAGMAVREFVSNAVDATVALGRPREEVKTLWVNESEVRAKDGLTRVFIEADSVIRAYSRDLTKYFLLMTKDYDPSVRIVPKMDPKSDARIYRKGVLVSEPGYRSLFDYNLPDIHLNEARKISESDARTVAAAALKSAPKPVLHRFFESIRDEVSGVFEMTIDPYYLMSHDYEKSDQDRKARDRWRTAFEEVFGEEGVVCDTTFAAEGIRRKGFRPVQVSGGMRTVLVSKGVKTTHDVLDHFALAGRDQVEVPSAVRDRMDLIWNTLVKLGVTKGRKKPAILEGFYNVMDAGSNTDGYYDSKRDAVGLSRDVFDSGFNLTITAIEEYAHAITGAADETRDLQDWCLRVATLLMEQQYFKKE